MKVIIFALEYKIRYLGWGREPIPKEFRSDLRIPLFHELTKFAYAQKASLAVLPGGFFRTDSPAGIAGALRLNPPKITVLAGRDNKPGNYCEVWVIAPNGTIRKRVPEAWIYTNKSKRQSMLEDITDRRFQLGHRMYAAFCCGDVIIDKRKAPITYSEAAFVLAHYSATGRNFTSSMCDLKIPVFLSHHVKYPYNTINFAYNGDKRLRPMAKPLRGKFRGLKWVGKVYSV